MNIYIYFKNLLGSPPKITDEPITRIISKQLDIKLGPFTKEELDSVLRKIKNRKALCLSELFEIELSICIKMDLALNNLKIVDMP